MQIKLILLVTVIAAVAAVYFIVKSMTAKLNIIDVMAFDGVYIGGETANFAPVMIAASELGITVNNPWFKLPNGEMFKVGNPRFDPNDDVIITMPDRLAKSKTFVDYMFYYNETFGKLAITSPADSDVHVGTYYIRASDKSVRANFGTFTDVERNRSIEIINEVVVQLHSRAKHFAEHYPEYLSRLGTLEKQVQDV